MIHVVTMNINFQVTLHVEHAKVACAASVSCCSVFPCSRDMLSLIIDTFAVNTYDSRTAIRIFIWSAWPWHKVLDFDKNLLWSMMEE